MRRSLLLAAVLLTSFSGFSQDFSNKGKDFWTAYGYHTSMTAANGNSQQMVLYFATDQVTNITITVPGSPYTIQTITTPAGNNVTTSVVVPKGTGGQPDFRIMTEGLNNNGIHITSDKPMVAYAHIYNGNCSGATILYPTNTLGREYYSVNYKNWSNQTFAMGWSYVLATDTGTTTIEITPSARTLSGWTAGTTYTVNLTQGQVYNIFGDTICNSNATCGGNNYKGQDLTGTKVKSINNGTGCKKIAVFSGSGRISITCNVNSSSSDNYMVQAMPRNAWGKKYLTVPANGNQAFNIYRVCVSNPAAVVKINGAVTGLPLQNGFYYELPATNQPQLIEADSAIMVAQYFTSQGQCGNGNTPGDPEVIYLSAVEQNIKTVQWNATPNFNITSHSFNVVLPNTGTAISSFRLDGLLQGGWVVHPQDPAYSYLKQTVSAGYHIIQSDSGFNAIAYGFGNAESYGYNAGTNIKDLYQQIGVRTQYGIETTPSVCTNSPFKFKVSLPYIPDSMYWDFHNAAGMLPNNTNVFVNNVGNITEDSTTVVNGKTIHWYSLPLLYTFTTVGVYPITITTYVPNGECGAQQDIDFDLTVTSPPVADFGFTPGGCVAEPFQFTELTPQIPKATYNFWWNFDDPGSGVNNTSNIRNPTHIFSAPGTYNVRYAAITTPGCLTDTITHQVVVAPLPNATISGNTTICINDPVPPVITFTGTGGTIPYTFYYNINGGGVQFVNSVAPSGTATVNAPTGTAGTFVYTLDSVRNVGSTLCVQSVAGQTATVIVQPDATITLSSPVGSDNQTVCIDNPIVNITYNIGGSGNGAILSAGAFPAGVTGSYAAGVFTIQGTPTVSGVFPYTITTQGPCLQSSLSGTITVNANSTISLSSAPGTDNQTVCINTPITTITYAVAAGGTGATITAGALPAGVTGSFAGGVFTILGTPTVSGVFNYTITTTGPCINPSVSGTITVQANSTITLSSAPGTDNQTVCINNAITPITYAVGGTGSGATITAGGLPAGVTGTYAAGVFTIQGTPTVSGVFPYTVTTQGPCVNPFLSGTITVDDNSTITLSSPVGTDNQTVCINTPIATITYSIAAGGTGATITAGSLPAGVTGTFAGGVFTIIGTPTVSGVFPYTVTTLGPCINPSLSGTITVQANSTITLSSAPGTDNQTVCINNPIVNITYAIGGTGNGATITAGGLPAGVTGTYAAGVFTIQGTPTVSGVFPYTITTQGPCVNPNMSGTITVTGNSTIALTSAVGTDNQAVCRNTTIIPITYAIAGTGTGATITAGGLPAGVTGTYAAGVFTIQGTPTVSGVFPYTITTLGPCVNPSASGTITVYALPTANFNFAAPTCETRVISFTDVSVPNSGTLSGWAWDFGDPGSGPLNTSTLQNPTHVFAAAGTYTVTLTVTSSFGCISNPIASIPVTINERPQAGFIIPEVCLSDTYAQFLDTSHIAAPSTIVAWAWNFGDPGSGPLNTSTLQNPTHSYSAVGNYNVELIVTTNTGCKDTIVQVLTVNGSFPTSIFTVNNPATLCANDSVAVVGQSTVFPGVITQVEITWDLVNFPAVVDVDPNPFFGKTYRHLYPNFQAPLTKNFTIRFRAFSGGVCLDDSIQVITVNAAPLVQFNNMPDTCLLAAPFSLTPWAFETGGVPGSYVFSGPGVSPTGIFSPLVAGIGTHTILYTYTATAAGCVDTASKTIRVLDTAHAVFTVVLPSCEGVPTQFTEASTTPGGIVLTNTVWNFGDASPLENHAPGSTFTHLYPGPGTYIVTMYNVTTTGCLSTPFSMPVTIDPNHIITLNSGPGSDNQTTCINVLINPISYLLSGGATNAVVTGLPAGMGFNVTGNQVNIFGAPTTAVGSPFAYTVTTSGNTCIPASASGTITVTSDHTITLSSAPGSDNQRVCLNTPIADIKYDLGGGATSYVISGLPSGVTSSQSGNTITITGTPNSTAGTPYNYIITTAGNNCVKATATGTIAVSPIPVPKFSFDKPSYCVPNAIVGFVNTSTIEDGTENGFTYSWDFGDPASGTANTSVAKNPTHWYSGVGPYNVKLTVTSIWGCSHDTTITVNSIHPQPKADFSTNKPHVCIQDDVTFTDLTDYKDGTAFQWNWSLGDGSIRNVPSFTYTYADTNTFFVSLWTVNSLGCNSDTVTKPFVVYPYPKVNAGPDRFILEGGSIILETVLYGNNMQYLWTPSLYLDNNRIAKPRVSRPLTDMLYTLTVTAQGGCSKSDDVFVKLLKFPVIPNTFTPNNDGINDTWRIDYLDTYPENRVQVFTRTGQLVFESRGYSKPWDGTIKGKPLPVDTYYYIIEPGSGRDPITGYVTIVK